MRIRFLTSCLAVLITASTGFCQDATGEPAEPARSVSPDPNAPTPARDIQMLNPDGTPATDAKVVAVLTTPGGIVDQNLKPRQVRKGDRQPLFELANTNGTVKIIFDSTQAIVASNEQGFLFLPVSAFGNKAKLREWAHVELDVSTVPEDQREAVTLNIMWTNSVQRLYTRAHFKPNRDGQDDFFARSVEREPDPDWRLDPMITWTQNVAVTNQSVRVPPGEIMVLLGSKQMNRLPETSTEMPPGSFSATLGLWQTPSGTVQRVALPEFGSIEGRIEKGTSSTLPDWSDSGSETVRILINTVPVLPQATGSNDEIFRKLTSDQGFKVRRDTAFSAMATTTDGRFRFPLVPVGSYPNICKLVEAPGLPSGFQGQPAFRSIPLKPDGDGEKPPIVVNAKNTTVADVRELPAPSRVVDGFSATGEVLDPGTPLRMPNGTDVVYEEHTRIVDGREVNVRVPRIVQRVTLPTNPFTPAPSHTPWNTDPSLPQTPTPIGLPGPPHVPLGGPAGFGPFSTNEGLTPEPEPDSATALIQNWLRTVTDPSDTTELRKLLQEHLQQEFDARQTSRKAEIERLQKLLQQSVEWLDKRAKNRDEIIKKRIDELIQSSVSNTPAGR